MSSELTDNLKQIIAILKDIDKSLESMATKILKEEPIPYREPSDWDHLLETPKQTKERDDLLVTGSSRVGNCHFCDSYTTIIQKGPTWFCTYCIKEGNHLALSDLK